MTVDDCLEKFQWMEDEARAAQANLQKLQMRPDLLLELFAAIRAQRRPPLGYVVGWVGVDGPELYSGRERIHHGEDAARKALANMRQEEPCMDFQLYEVREVPGCAT